MTITEKIEQIRSEWKEKLCILGHYYQRDAVLNHADFVGDSLELAKKAAAAKEAEKIVFCGVHFMAESADILSDEHQTVYMPDPNAGCPMADMAPMREVIKAWEEITGGSGRSRAGIPTDRSVATEPFDSAQGLEPVERRDGHLDSTPWIPIAYVNSTAALKAFCGEHGGATCTSSNAVKVFDFFLKQNKKILFLPDEHLGANTAHDLGLPDDAVAVFNPSLAQGGLNLDQIKKAKILAWKGYCHVHMFSVDDIKRARAEHPDAKIIVHPETPKEVLRLADAHGSTSRIVKYVEEAKNGATIVIGTEINLVTRLAARHRPRVAVHPLRPSMCRNMALTTEEKLLKVLENFPEENEIHVEPKLKTGAALALKRMLDIS